MDKKEEKEDDFELSLELSIGGRYGKPQEDSKGKTRDWFSGQNCNRNDNNQEGIFAVSRSDFCSNLEPQRKKEIQALRRQEARKKREERIKKSDEVFLEAQKLQIRVKEREIREKEDSSDGNEGLHPNVQQGCAQARSYRCLKLPLDCEWGEINGCPTASPNASQERSSSAASDYQSTSQKGGSSSDTGSQSSRRQCNNILTKAPLDHHLQINGPPSQIEPNHRGLGVASKPATLLVPQPSGTKFMEKSSLPQASDSCSTPDKPTSAPQLALAPLKRKTSGPHIPKPPNHTQNPASLAPHMPYVSTTGNGPNGKTVTGFLYKYTNNEVSIMCTCHGSSFSPAEFVEHAGGVNILNPLRHITVIPPALGCP